MLNTEQINEKFLEQYGSEDAVRKFSTGTAGFGIDYLLRNDYAKEYLNAVDSYLKISPPRPLRLLEFGCGAGMNIITMVSLLERRRIPVECAYGTDFSERLVQSATQEASSSLPPDLRKKLNFYVARNEKLVEDLAAARGKPAENLIGFFDLIIGVNIDMNDRFPAFRSNLKGSTEDPAECYLPSLEEYAAPFKAAGFEIVKKGNFCWIPHSAGRALTLACRFASPILNLVVPSRAMRSLVIARTNS